MEQRCRCYQNVGDEEEDQCACNKAGIFFFLQKLNLNGKLLFPMHICMLLNSCLKLGRKRRFVQIFQVLHTRFIYLFIFYLITHIVKV